MEAFRGFASFAGPRYTEVVYMKVNTVGRLLSEVRKAYLAGLIDGDGAIMAHIEPHQEKKFKFRIRVSVKVTLSDKSDITWLRQLTGVGYVRENRRTFEWIVRDKQEVKHILAMITPYLHSKHRQGILAKRVLAHKVDTEKSLYQAACLADTLSRLNVRSEKRRKNFATMIKKVFPVTT